MRWLTAAVLASLALVPSAAYCTDCNNSPIFEEAGILRVKGCTSWLHGGRGGCGGIHAAQWLPSNFAGCNARAPQIAGKQPVEVSCMWALLPGDLFIEPSPGKTKWVHRIPPKEDDVFSCFRWLLDCSEILSDLAGQGHESTLLVSLYEQQ